MGVETGVTGCSYEMLLLGQLNVLPCDLVNVVLREAKVDKVDYLVLLSDLRLLIYLPLLGCYRFYQKVLWFNVSMDHSSLVNCFQPHQLRPTVSKRDPNFTIWSTSKSIVICENCLLHCLE